MRVKLIDGFEVTPSHLETIAYYHGAIDPDSGHIICHGHTIRTAVITTPSKPVPLLMIGDCFGFVAGDENIAALIEVSEEVSGIHVEKGRLLIGGVEVDPTWGFHALGFARDSMEAPRMYKLSVERGDRNIDAVIIRFTSPEHIAFLLFECRGASGQKAQTTMHV